MRDDTDALFDGLKNIRLSHTEKLDCLKNIRLSQAEKSEIAKNVKIHVRKGVDPRLQVDMVNQDFLQIAKGTALSPAEKARIREALLSSMEKKPAVSWIFVLRRLITVTAAFVILVASGAGLSYAAESSVPGDLLYPVKVKFNESVVGSFQQTPEARARYEARKAQRRLEEARILAEQSQLNAEYSEKLTTRFQEHTAQLQQEMKVLVDNKEHAKAGDIGIDFDATLVAYADVLSHIDMSAQTPTLQKVRDAVREARLETEETTFSITRSSDDEAKKSATEKAWAEAKMELDAVQKIVEKAGKNYSPEVLTRLRAGQKVLDISSSTSSSVSADEKLRWSRSALRRAREAKAYLDLKVNASASSSSTANEDVLPTRDSDKEDLEFSTSVRLRMTREKIKTLQENLREVQETIGEDVGARVESTQQLLDTADVQLQNGDISDALETSNSALEQAESMTEEVRKLVPGL